MNAYSVIFSYKGHIQNVGNNPGSGQGTGWGGWWRERIADKFRV